MDTYGVTFENFQPEFGNAVWREVEESIIPASRENLAHFETLLKEYRADLVRIKKAYAAAKSAFGFAGDLKELFDGGNGSEDCSFRELLSCSDLIKDQDRQARREAAVKLTESWARNTCNVRDDINEVLSFAKGVVEYKITICEGYACEWRAYVGFYTKILEAERGKYVFYTVDKKYKVRVCRDLTKLLTEIVGLGEIIKNASQKKGEEEKELAKSGFVEFYKNAKIMLKAYREFKLLVADFGIDIACKVLDKYRQNLEAVDESSSAKEQG